MGCDIHTMLEANRPINNIKKWVNIDYFKKKPYYDDDYEENEFDIIEFYSHRSYLLFSILAGVRNYNDIVPISEPKGIPKDCSNCVKDKGSWDNLGDTKEMNLAKLFSLLKIEVNELEDALLFGTELDKSGEATDVCNLAMMIQDVITNRE